MRRILIALFAVAPFALSPAYAQEVPGPGRFEVGAFPVGGVFFTSSSSRTEPAFDNFALGASLTYNINRWLGVEGEVGSAIGLRQNLGFRGTVLSDTPSPSLYAYNAGLVLTPFTGNHGVVPYAIVGAGGMTLLDTTDVLPLGLGGNETYFVGNVGGGLKWYAHPLWGLRADYRLLMVNDKPTAPEFFGRDSVRYGHRVYGGLLFSY